MHDERIHVRVYSGYKAGERPTDFELNGEEVVVIEILDMWLEENFADRQRKRFFVVKGNDGNTHKIYLDEKTGEWFLRKRA
ncbi:MAG: hypothetical protein AB1442_05835 [Nitrospirota bacterium]